MADGGPRAAPIHSHSTGGIDVGGDVHRGHEGHKQIPYLHVAMVLEMIKLPEIHDGVCEETGYRAIPPAFLDDLTKGLTSEDCRVPPSRGKRC